MWSCICRTSCSFHACMFRFSIVSGIFRLERSEEKTWKKGFRWKSVSIWVLLCLKCCINMCRYMHDNVYTLDTCIFSRPSAHFWHTKSAYVKILSRRKILWSHHASVKVPSSQGPRGVPPDLFPHCGHEMPRFGELRFVHLGCLRYWIRGRLNLTDGATGGVTAEHVVQSEETASLRHSRSRKEDPRRHFPRMFERFFRNPAHTWWKFTDYWVPTMPYFAFQVM